MSEPGGGSDVAACQTTAKRVGDDLVINGQKMWITNAFQADWMCLLANTEQGPGMNKIPPGLAELTSLNFKLIQTSP